MAKTVGLGLAAVFCLGAVALCALGSPPAIAAGASNPPAFAPDQVARGAALAGVGDCAVCHTADGGEPYAGGRPVSTPFGVVYGTNVTPDPQTGIGGWSLAAFDRALRRGVRRDGAQLYPAMPYDHFAGLSDRDVADLYAFLMTRRPVQARTPATRLIPPLGFRPVLLAWKLLFFKPRPAPAGRGAYLIQALAHCGACHTPHGPLGDEQAARPLAGGSAEGWYAPPLDASSPASAAWTEDRLYSYLRTGLDVNHAAAAGPMGPVARGLALAPEADVRAIAHAVAGRMAPARAPLAPNDTDRMQQATAAHPAGAAAFEGACAACHGAGAPMMLDGRPALSRGSPLWEGDPRDTLQIVLQGLKSPTGDSGPFMPAFDTTFSDADLVDLAAYLRARYTDKPAWTGLKSAAAKARRAGA